ncbi:hypothetical protein GAGA_0884 [Paraglaciecola agarilytica NO2]|uniref:Rieske domain-containing protein n=2 Tax=Paraglaciecola chathamensis TaxID=368405 RepID=A0ABQ0I359_9ALTE|nr:hypothetical protein GAGA_0884 [Paraglaciecola agarilytica NO2]
MYHGIKFAPDGKAIEIPGQDMIPGKAKVKSYPAIEKHSWMWVWMGDPKKADEELIPPAVGMDHPDFLLGHGTLNYEAEARLINDNLLDFSHLPYIHKESFGSSEEFAQKPPLITPLERGVRFSRWQTNLTGAPDGNDTGEMIDVWSTYDYLIPGILLMESAGFPAGTTEAFNHDCPDMDKSICNRNFTSQAVTPTTKKGTRYFFNWGPYRKHGGAEMRDAMMGIGEMAFGEDKRMIEAQQKIIDSTEKPVVMAITNDRGVVMYNRLINKFIDQEQSET